MVPLMFVYRKEGVTMSELSKLTDEELLAKAHRLALESLVEQMEQGEYISSGNLSYLNTLSKNSGIKSIEVSDEVGGIKQHLASLVEDVGTTKRKRKGTVV